MGYEFYIVHDPTLAEDKPKTDKVPAKAEDKPKSLFEQAVELGFEGAKNTGKAKLELFIAEAKAKLEDVEDVEDVEEFDGDDDGFGDLED